MTNDVVSRFRPKQATDQSPVPVIATAQIAELAGPNGLLPLQVEGEPFVGRVVATARRFPTVSGDFVLADREALSTALNADAPGSAVIDEIWLKSSSASDETRMKAVLSRPAFAGLETSFRGDLRAALDREPVARASILALLVSAVVGFVLALAGLALALSTDIRDERAELFDLEAQGRDSGTASSTPAACARSVFSALASCSVWAWARFSARLSWTLYGSLPEESSPSRLCCSHLTGHFFSEGSGCSFSSRSLWRWSSPGRRFGGRPRCVARGRDMAAISLTDVFRVYSTPEGDAAALQGLTLSIAEHEIVVVVGPSGSGKTTLLRLLAGLDRPSAGGVRVFEKEISKLSARKLAGYRATEIGYVDQHYTRFLAPELSAREIEQYARNRTKRRIHSNVSLEHRLALSRFSNQRRIADTGADVDAIDVERFGVFVARSDERVREDETHGESARGIAAACNREIIVAAPNE